MSISAGLAIWKTAFELTPIIFSGGIAQFMPGGMLGIANVLSALGSAELDGAFASFMPVPGGTVVEQDIARYPFANQVVAANAVIGQPLHISMLMVCPARGRFSMFEKLAVFSALQAAITLHNNNGGTYIVATPSYIYPNCVFRKMSDVSAGNSRQPQSAWILDFEQPLITLGSGGTVASQSSMLQALSSLGFVDSASLGWSGPLATLSPPSLAGAAVTPGVSGAVSGSASTITSSALPALPGFPAIGYNGAPQ